MFSIDNWNKESFVLPYKDLCFSKWLKTFFENHTQQVSDKNFAKKIVKCVYILAKRCRSYFISTKISKIWENFLEHPKWVDFFGDLNFDFVFRILSMKISLIKSFWGVALAINQHLMDRYNDNADLRTFSNCEFFIFSGIPRSHQVPRPQKDAWKS